MRDVAKSLDDLLAKRPADRKKVAAHEARMRAKVRAHRLLEIREAHSPTQSQVAQNPNTPDTTKARPLTGDRALQMS